MRQFSSYGPVDKKNHFTVPRKALVKECLESLVGDPEAGGHYFTIWAPRQTGKTWLMQQVISELESLCRDRYIIAKMSCQGIIIEPDMPEDAFLGKIPRLILDGFDMDVDAPETWEDWVLFFHRRKGLFKKPIILFIDEFDSLPRHVIDYLVTLFRDMYLKRESYLLHGLALIGVRAVLGVESERGSPFNIQRSLHVPDFTPDEVENLFRQYQEESGQPVEPSVVEQVYEATRGQPGLVCWFGELLTTTYNPGTDRAIDGSVWRMTYHKACHSEWNNSILNLIQKARSRYREQVIRLFSRSDMLFSLDADWCSYLYLNGIIRPETVSDGQGELREISRFSSPFIQKRIYNALSLSLIGEGFPILALDPLDDLSDVLTSQEPDLPALIERYKSFLGRLKERGMDPWQEQPRRTDLHLTEAVGHFHLLAWLKSVLEEVCLVSPEFPTGNGRVDLHLNCAGKRGIIEVKSFRSRPMLERAKIQAAGYAKKLELPSITLALFVPVLDPAVLAQLSGESFVDGVRVVVVAIGWG